MSSLENTSQVPEYYGPTYHEKRVYPNPKYYQVKGVGKKRHDFSKDSDYEEVRPGVWRKVWKKRSNNDTKTV